MKKLSCLLLLLAWAALVWAQDQSSSTTAKRGYISIRPECSSAMNGAVFVNYAGGEERCSDGVWTALTGTTRAPVVNGASFSAPLVNPMKAAQRLPVAIPSGTYDSTEDSVIVSVAGDDDLVPEKIADDTIIFDVEGTLVAAATTASHQLTGDKLKLQIVNIHRTPETRLSRKAKASNIGARTLCAAHDKGLLSSYPSEYTAGSANTLTVSSGVMSALVGGGGGYTVFTVVNCKK